ncbi:tripartite tricarboxylate transporter [Rhodobacteraceae bacterium RKSG542]|uniref:tripartite tricarboxylate transporter TctB family protein n=1 Tax=Pseudovibrio flavus TaxID=2529854 RepID=UPI0012BC729E|nr:tripartite tricarboxylate transporter TctB family protein [Pseudovibrio flavus]MTI18035.1 tripartite tricarboxylate transporter [Pseudovibrio flavus]
MENQSSSPFSIVIDFDTSHLFFPTLILWLLGLLGLAILIQKGPAFYRAVASGEKKLRFFEPDADKVRLFGTLGLMVVYFIGMDYVGRLFPNMGYGFWLVSIPFLFGLSCLYAHELDKRKLLYITLNALVAPTFAWFVLSELFNVTLP